MIKTCIIVVPTLWTDDTHSDSINTNEQKAKLDKALHQEHYRVKLMNNYEYEGVLFTQYVLEKGR